MIPLLLRPLLAWLPLLWPPQPDMGLVAVVLGSRTWPLAVCFMIHSLAKFPASGSGCTFLFSLVAWEEVCIQSPWGSHLAPLGNNSGFVQTGPSQLLTCLMCFPCHSCTPTLASLVFQLGQVPLLHQQESTPEYLGIPLHIIFCTKTLVSWWYSVMRQRASSLNANNMLFLTHLSPILLRLLAKKSFHMK